MVFGLRRKEGAFGIDTHADGRWTFLWILHENDWADGDAEGAAQRLARLAPEGTGIMLSAHMREVTRL